MEWQTKPDQADDMAYLDCSTDLAVKIHRGYFCKVVLGPEKR